ncbi:sulfite oxidase heme-binding subunit YedZ [Thiomonas intermedia]|uniref:sulfite oxidase heme-binding subunit YedZ n=1 Tax=Thiomonas intermedia TaxID=926 RepID=UPI0009A47889|nr:protein-methionine-sulfoxide reductase heme-binding subunit MsrQ [Thiomonas intermedia]
MGTSTALSWPRRLLRGRAVKPLIFLLCLLPFAGLFWRGWSNNLGPNPEQTVIWTTGLWALRLLLITLAVTPLRKLTGWAELARLRRMFGLFVYFYALLHFTAWLGLVNGFSVDMAVRDIAKHPFVLAGMSALLLMTPLALTSTNGMIKRLGARRWQTLHRLVYGVGVVAVFHFWWGKLAKNNTASPTVYALILAVLLGLRLWWAWRAAQARRAHLKGERPADDQGKSRSLA